MRLIEGLDPQANGPSEAQERGALAPASPTAPLRGGGRAPGGCQSPCLPRAAAYFGKFE
jgi:hypothetical protein